MRTRFGPARCCCGSEDPSPPLTDTAYIIAHHVRGGRCPHGTVKVYDDNDALVGEYDFSVNGLTGPDAGRVAVPIPATGHANARLVISLPRCKTRDTRETVPVPLRPNQSVMISMSEVETQGPGDPFAGTSIALTVKPDEGYGVVGTAQYPQVDTLVLTDSVLGQTTLRHANDPGNLNNGYWYGVTNGVYQLSRSGLSQVREPAQIAYAYHYLTPTSWNITAFHRYVADGLAGTPAKSGGFGNFIVSSNTGVGGEHWTPTNDVSIEASGSRNSPVSPLWPWNGGDPGDPPISVTFSVAEAEAG